MRAPIQTFLESDVPQLEPIIGIETVDDGWRALTADGELLQVHGQDGAPIKPPTDAVTLFFDGEPIGRREIVNGHHVDIGRYLDRFDDAVVALRSNRSKEALAAVEEALSIAPTLRARFNKAMILLDVGRWREGINAFIDCELHPAGFQRPQTKAALAAGCALWRGKEGIAGKRIVLVSDHGLGDSLMMLRFVPLLRGLGAKVAILAPTVLHSIARQFAPIVDDFEGVDYFCPLLWLIAALDRFSPECIAPEAYVEVYQTLVTRWRERIGTSERKRIGIAWSVGKFDPNDYPREIPLVQLVGHLARDDVELYSVQAQGQREAAELGVKTFEFDDLADCAALMSLMDEIVTVDTAAVHLAGATGHPNVTLLLSYWASWRWRANWYPGVRICRQSFPRYWEDALAQIT